MSLQAGTGTAHSEESVDDKEIDCTKSMVVQGSSAVLIITSYRQLTSASFASCGDVENRVGGECVPGMQDKPEAVLFHVVYFTERSH